MAFLSWHERFRLGQVELDAQHKMLFELVNHFDDVIRMELTEELPLILTDLIECSVQHFAFEEALLQRVGFPKLAEHERVHAELIRQVQDMRSRMMAGGHESPKAIVRFLADWLTSHIMREDLEYKAYLKL